MSENNLELGSNVQLSGFGELENKNNAVVNKIVGSYAKKFADQHEKFESLKLNLKPIHNTEKKNKIELHAQAFVNGKSFNTEVVDYNLYFALDSALKKLQATMLH